MKAHWWNQEFLVQCLAQANTRKSLLRTHTVFIFRLRKLRWCQLGFAQHGWQCHQKRSSKANLTCLSVLWRENALAQSDRSVKSILEIKISQKKKISCSETLLLLGAFSTECNCPDAASLPITGAPLQARKNYNKYPILVLNRKAALSHFGELWWEPPSLAFV